MANDLHTILTINLEKPGFTLASAISDRDAHGQFFIAEEYLTAVELMTETCGEEIRLLRPRYMLLCQALELCLKAFLLNRGVDAKTLNKPPMNHDLRLLLDACQERLGSGKPFIAPKHQNMIRELAPAASMFYFRYGHKQPATVLEVASIYVPLMSDALDATHGLFDVVRREVLTIRGAS
ncbi:hypothetical protein [Methylobacterium sp. Leaf88]|uniref:hypothetical protein n=1 Tax=Methylobacterium sp. Leaf88 TaxID=1736244 RepID=UPI0006F3FAFA|nr:hypothetical protein [Methylobacterium sp. Leaf88]KQO70646.1 hypothetical protein ASF20_19315 [Methylobacterium sp. Leaf88]